MPTEVTYSSEEKMAFRFQPLTHAGQPAPIDGTVSFVIVAGDGVTMPIDPVDPVLPPGFLTDYPPAESCWLVPGPTLGDLLMKGSCDADLGAGMQLVEDTVVAHIVSPTADHLTVTHSPAMPQ